MMRAIGWTGLLAVAATLVLSACRESEQAAMPPVAPPAGDPSEVAEVTEAAPAWPDSLRVMGDGYPNPGDPCRRIGETEATVNFLDDSATLAGCLSPADAAALGGMVVGTVDGVTLVSVPAGSGQPGDGDGQGDAMVPGTKYHATGQVRCEGYRGAAQGMCDAGVVRNPETGSAVDVMLPGGIMRTIFFNPDGSFLSFSTAQADGTAAMESSASREGDTTIAVIGEERYEIPDVLVLGD